MNTLLALAFLVTTTYAQQLTCPEGTRPSGGLGTSGCLWRAGCYTPKEIEDGYTFIAKCMCGEGGLYMGTGTLAHVRSSKWIDGACVTDERWEKLVGHKWVRITKEEHDRLLHAKPRRKTRRKR